MASSSIEEGLKTYILAAAAVTNKIGQRLYFVEAPQGETYPYATYRVISDPHDPESFGNVDTGQPRVQISVWDKDRYNAQATAQLIRDRIQHYQGAMDGVTVTFVQATGTLIMREPNQNIFQAIFDALLQYNDV